MAAQSTLVLRDIHQPPAPPWWPPAPGWWLVGALVVAALAVWAALRLRRQRHHAAQAAVFDAALAAAATPSDRIAAMSELLRRAARRRDPAADRLQGEAWLAFLDGDDAAHPFTGGAGRLLLDGGFRRDVAPAQVAALLPLARARFLQLGRCDPALVRSRRAAGGASTSPARAAWSSTATGPRPRPARAHQQTAAPGRLPHGAHGDRGPPDRDASGDAPGRERGGRP
jgi:hypothetical protein